MIRFIQVLFFVIPVAVTGQTITQPDTTLIKLYTTFKTKPQAFYLDAVEIKLDKVYLDPDNVQDIQLLLNPSDKAVSSAREAYFIVRKIPQELVTLTDISSEYSARDTSSIQYVIDEELIRDTANVRLEPTTIKEVAILKGNHDRVDHGFYKQTTFLITTKLGKRKED